MSKTPYYLRNHNQPWTNDDIKLLNKLAKEDTPTGLIGSKLGRTEAAIYSKASEYGISLMPPNPHHKKK